MIHTGDCVEVMRTMPADSVDAVVTDPPYGLEFMGKEWDRLVGGDVGHRRGGHGIDGQAGWGPRGPIYGGRNFTKQCTGCGKRDKFENPHDCEGEWERVPVHAAPIQAQAMQAWHLQWAIEAFRVLKPGGYILAFGGTRTVHRLASAIEDAGFEIRDELVWIYASGFPKSKSMRDIGRPELGTAMKPAHEPIVMARKPIAATAYNVRATVEAELRARGVTGDIEWSVPNAESQENLADAGSAAESVRLDTASKTRKSDDKPSEIGTLLTPNEPSNTPSSGGSDSEPKSLQPTVASAPAAASRSRPFSPSTTSAGEEPNTARRSSARSMSNSSTKDSRPDTGSFAGIATGLFGSLASVLIQRNPDGIFEWPSELPESVGGIAANVTRYGTGALNIDGSRIGYAPDDPTLEWGEKYGGGQLRSDGEPYEGNKSAYAPGIGHVTGTVQPQGRWPSNVLLSSPELFDQPNPEVVGSGATSQDWGQPNRGRGDGSLYEGGWSGDGRTVGFGDSGGYSRFFAIPRRGDVRGSGPDKGPQEGDAVGEARDAEASTHHGDHGEPGGGRLATDYPTAFLIPKADRADREPTLRGQLELGPPPASARSNPAEGRRNALGNPRENAHPTVKPTDLMRHLVRLVTPPGGTVLDCFLGSGSTAIACELEGFPWIGIERDPEYVAIAEARLNGVQRGLGLDVPAPVQQRKTIGGQAPASGPTLTGESTSNSRGKFNGVENTPFYGKQRETKPVEPPPPGFFDEEPAA